MWQYLPCLVFALFTAFAVAKDLFFPSRDESRVVAVGASISLGRAPASTLQSLEGEEAEEFRASPFEESVEWFHGEL